MHQTSPNPAAAPSKQSSSEAYLLHGRVIPSKAASLQFHVKPTYQVVRSIVLRGDSQAKKMSSNPPDRSPLHHDVDLRKSVEKVDQKQKIGYADVKAQLLWEEDQMARRKKHELHIKSDEISAALDESPLQRKKKAARSQSAGVSRGTLDLLNRSRQSRLSNTSTEHHQRHQGDEVNGHGTRFDTPASREDERSVDRSNATSLDVIEMVDWKLKEIQHNRRCDDKGDVRGGPSRSIHDPPSLAFIRPASRGERGKDRPRSAMDRSHETFQEQSSPAYPQNAQHGISASSSSDLAAASPADLSHLGNVHGYQQPAEKSVVSPKPNARDVNPGSKLLFDHRGSDTEEEHPSFSKQAGWKHSVRGERRLIDFNVITKEELERIRVTPLCPSPMMQRSISANRKRKILDQTRQFWKTTRPVPLKPRLDKY